MEDVVVVNGCSAALCSLAFAIGSVTIIHLPPPSYKLKFSSCYYIL